MSYEPPISENSRSGTRNEDLLYYDRISPIVGMNISVNSYPIVKFINIRAHRFTFFQRYFCIVIWSTAREASDFISFPITHAILQLKLLQNDDTHSKLYKAV